MNSVLLSIQPKQCENIASGKQTIIVRKTKPKLDTPFKCYMYMTKDAKKHYYIDEYLNVRVELIPQKIIGEFVCDEIFSFRFAPYYSHIICQREFHDVTSYDVLKESCMTFIEMFNYIEDVGYGWHISDLIIYDKPRELREFYRICPEWGKDDFPSRCRSCNHYNNCADDVAFDGKVMLARPPQSWCYIASIDCYGYDYKQAVLDELKKQGASQREVSAVKDATIRNGLKLEVSPEDVAWAILQ